jgi:hypothetical protein
MEQFAVWTQGVYLDKVNGGLCLGKKERVWDEEKANSVKLFLEGLDQARLTLTFGDGSGLQHYWLEEIEKPVQLQKHWAETHWASDLGWKPGEWPEVVVLGGIEFRKFNEHWSGGDLKYVGYCSGDRKELRVVND